MEMEKDVEYYKKDTGFAEQKERLSLLFEHSAERERRDEELSEF